jgi:hypothetical protein
MGEGMADFISVRGQSSNINFVLGRADGVCPQCNLIDQHGRLGTTTPTEVEASQISSKSPGRPIS